MSTEALLSDQNDLCTQRIEKLELEVVLWRSWATSYQAEMKELEQCLESACQSWQGARDAAEVAMAAAHRAEELNAELIRQCGHERQSWCEAESAVRIAANALAWYAMSDPERADEAMDEIEKLLSPEAFARIFKGDGHEMS